MPNDNSVLMSAMRNRKDEFYTKYEDIQVEMNNYTEAFRGKTVLCNCDDPFESNFCKFFLRNFNYLGIKRLICTSYSGSPFAFTQMSLFDEENAPVVNTHGYVLDVKAVPMKNGRGVTDEDITALLKSERLRKLKGNGDFRSDECIKYLRQADIVVTNPPFSMWREYLAQLIEYKKRFIIIGNQNCLTYKEVFPLFKNNEIWYGVSIHSHGRDFMVPDDYPLEAYEFRTDKEGRRYINVKGVRWITNIDVPNRHDDLILYKKYSPEEYPKYDGYNAIEVSKTSDIPVDYPGEMGVPISFIDKYNPDQFEIIGLDRYTVPKEFLVGGRVAINGKPKYARILIKNKRLEAQE